VARTVREFPQAVSFSPTRVTAGVWLDARSGARSRLDWQWTRMRSGQRVWGGGTAGGFEAGSVIRTHVPPDSGHSTAMVP
jgi:hypothetical protein